MCLMHQTAEKDPRQGSLQVPEWVELQRKTSQRGLLIASYKRLEKDSQGHNSRCGGSPFPAHLVPPGSPKAKWLPHLHLNSPWGRAATAKRVLCLCAGSLRSCLPLCDSVDCGLPGFSVREGSSPGKNTGAYWPILVAIPF